MQQQEIAQFNMLEQQVRPNEVNNTRVLDAIREIDRASFVDEELVGLAYADTALSMGYGQTMLPPLLQAKILQAVDVQPNEVVLEIGTGTGYLTALIAQLAQQVISVEIVPELSAQAQQNLADFNNISLQVGDASKGWQVDDRVDVIVATAAFVNTPDELLNLLKVGGRMLVAVGEAPAMNLQLIHRVTEREWQSKTVLETVMPHIINAEPKAEFEF
jgi:protein-L-isoaspartate(D-aspartate) O-methyltransferase